MSGWIRVRDSEGAEGTVPAAARDAYEGRGYEVIGGPVDHPQELEPDVDFGPAASEPPKLGVNTPENAAKEEILAQLAEQGPPKLGVADDPVKEQILAELAESERPNDVPDDPEQAFAGAETAMVSTSTEDAPPEDAPAAPETPVADGGKK